MWPKTHVETFRWCLLEKRNHIVRTCFHVCMYVYMHVPTKPTKRQSHDVTWTKSWVRINLCNGGSTHFQPISMSTKCSMEVLPQWNKKVGMNNILHGSISTKLRCYLQYKYLGSWKQQKYSYHPLQVLSQICSFKLKPQIGYMCPASGSGTIPDCHPKGPNQPWGQHEVVCAWKAKGNRPNMRHWVQWRSMRL
jgi:hypothetical protein